MRPRTTLALTLALLGAACGGGGEAPPIAVPEDKAPRTDPRPSFVVFFTDDHGFADLGVQSVLGDVRTPQLDALARAGVRVTQGYVTAPQCVPSRAALLTGMHQNRFGVDTNDDGPLRPEQLTIAERLRDQGYLTAMAGKWHLGLAANNSGNVPPGSDPALFYAANQGFGEYFEGNLDRYIASHDAEGHSLPGAPQHVQDSRFRVDLATQWAVSFIRRHRSQPFLLYVPYYAPHLPLEAPETYTRRFDHVTDQTRKLGLSMIAAIDDGVGRVRAELERGGLTPHTLILFIGDNGAPLGGGWNGSLNDPLVGEKGMLTDGGVRVPFVAAWPGRIPAGRVLAQPVSTLDVVPTLLAAAGSPRPPDLDGTDLLPHFTGAQTGPVHDALYWRWRSQAGIRTDRWKLIRLGTVHRLLYDMTATAPEQQNVAAGNPEIADALEQQLAAWAATMQRPGLPAGEPEIEDRDLFRSHGLIP